MEQDRDTLLVSDLLSDLEVLRIVRPRCWVFGRYVCGKPQQVERPGDQPVIAQLLGNNQTLVSESMVDRSGAASSARVNQRRPSS